MWMARGFVVAGGLLVGVAIGIALNLALGHAASFLNLPIFLDSVGTVLAAVLAGPVMDYAQATARQLADPMPYIEAVLVRQEGTK